MTRPMHAWRFTGPGEPLALARVPRPAPGAGEVLIEVRAAGLCHSDVSVLDDPGWVADLGRLPITLGHEIAGVVAALGAGVEGVAVGEAVAVEPGGRTRPGFAQDGGFAEFCVADAADLVPVDDGLPFELAAIGTDAGRVAHHAVVGCGRVAAGQRVGIVGYGGLGQIGTRLAVLAGATVHVAERRSSLWPGALAAGAAAVAPDVRDFADRDLDVVVDFAGAGTTSAAIETVRRGGRVVQVGLAARSADISIAALVLGEVELVGARGGTAHDIAAVYRLFASGQLLPEVEAIPFAGIPAGLERLRRGDVRGRLVATPPVTADVCARRAG